MSAALGLLLLVHAPLPGNGSLTWEAPPSCPGEPEVAALVAEHFIDADPPTVALDVRAVVSDDGSGGFIVEIELAAEDQTFTRTLDVGDCDEAREATALVIAMTLDSPPEIVPTPLPEPVPEDAPAPEETPTPVLTEPTPIVDAPPEVTEAPPPPPPPRRIRADLAVGGGVTGGHLPAAGGLVAVSVGATARRWEAGATGTYVFARQFVLDPRPTARARLSVATAGVYGGPRFAVGPLHLLPLAGFEAGAMIARGLGADENRTRTVPWLLADVGAALRYSPLRWLALGLRAEATFALLRHSFDFGARFPLLTTAVAAGRGTFWVRFRLP